MIGQTVVGIVIAELEFAAPGIIVLKQLSSGQRSNLAQDPEAEPLVEIIVAKRIEKADGNYTHAKNSRRLQFCFSVQGKSDPFIPTIDP